MSNLRNLFRQPSDRRAFLRLISLSGAALAADGCHTAKPAGSLSDRPYPAAGPGKDTAAERTNSSFHAVIDSHIHVVPPVPAMKPSPGDMDRLMQGPREVLAEYLKQEMDRAQIGLAFGMGRLNGPENDPLGVDATLRLAELVPGLKAVGVADPRHTDRRHLHQVERQLDRQRAAIVGLKAYLGYVHSSPSDPGYRPYLRLAAKYQLPMIFHTGDTWSTKAKLRFAHPLELDDVAVEHPDVRFVLAHLGNPWLIDAAEVIYKNDNVWADLSGLYVGDEQSIDLLLTQKPLPEVASGVMIGELKKALGYAERPDRLLYGSDWPLVPMNVYRRFVEAVIPHKSHQAVFRTNAEQLFSVKLLKADLTRG